MPSALIFQGAPENEQSNTWEDISQHLVSLSPSTLNLQWIRPTPEYGSQNSKNLGW